MLNAGYKKAALEECKKAGEEYQEEYQVTIKRSETLYLEKKTAISILVEVDEYVHSLSNKPQEIVKIASEITVRRKSFENEIVTLEKNSNNSDKVSGGVAGAGVLAGVGIAAFGPTAAMGIATTFGTASTGTAIAALTGVAQTNAALAWLGGGALAAGGGGMAAGNALLALAGPVGWGIGGAALIGGGLLASSKNKKIAQEAEEKTKKIKGETDVIKRIKIRVDSEIKAVKEIYEGVKRSLVLMHEKGVVESRSFTKRIIAFFRKEQKRKIEHRDYSTFTESDKDELMKMLNAAQALSERIGVKIS